MALDDDNGAIVLMNSVGQLPDGFVDCMERDEWCGVGKFAALRVFETAERVPWWATMCPDHQALASELQSFWKTSCRRPSGLGSAACMHA